jgi:hypothetical protein
LLSIKHLHGTDQWPWSQHRLEPFDIASIVLDASAFQAGLFHAWQGLVHVMEDLTLPASNTLTIAPGTRILVAPGVSLTLEGSLQCEGNEQEPIGWACLDPDDVWKGIVGDGTSATFAFTHISQVETGFSHQGDGTLSMVHGTIQATVHALNIDHPDSSNAIADCRFDSELSAVFMSNSTATFERVTVRAQNDAFVTSESQLTILDSVIEGAQGIVHTGELDLSGCLIKSAGGTGLIAGGISQ